VTERSGDEFGGRYETEDDSDKYAWEARGTITSDGKVRFPLRKPLNAAAEATNARAEVWGECIGPKMSLTFRDNNDGTVAKMTLALEK